MDVQLPDGTVIKDVPDGMSKADLTAKLKSNGYDVSKLETPSESNPIFDYAKQVYDKTTFNPIKAVGNLAGLPQLMSGDPAQMAAAPITQFAVKAGEPIIGAANRLGIGRDVLPQFNALAAQGGASDINPAGIAGSVLNPVGLGMAKALPAATTLLGQMGQGAAMGGVGGFLSDAKDNYEAAKNALIGSAGGAIAAPVVRAGIATANLLNNRVFTPIANLFTKEGPTNISRNIIAEKVGEQNIPGVLQQMNPQQLIPGSAPTVAQATAGLPAASPLSAIESRVAGMPGGASNQFGIRTRDQNFANEVAQQTRDYFTDPMRSAAVAAANAKGGVPSAPIVAQIDQLASKAGDRASDVVTKTLGAVRSKVEALGSSGPIDAADLYTVRKEIGNTIATFSKENQNWDKNLTSKLERSIQLAIDDAIEKAGGTGWKAYLAEYASRSKAIDADTLRRELAKNPLQPTNLGTAVVSQGASPDTPHLISKKVAMANWILHLGRGDIEPKVSNALSEIMLDPSKFSSVMSNLQPKQIIQVQDALKAANALSFAGAQQQ